MSRECKISYLSAQKKKKFAHKSVNYLMATGIYLTQQNYCLFQVAQINTNIKINVMLLDQ